MDHRGWPRCASRPSFEKGPRSAEGASHRVEHHPRGGKMFTNGQSAALLLLFFLAAPAASGQAPVTVPESSTVRLASPAYTGVATLAEVRPGSLELDLARPEQRISVPIESVTRLEYRRSATKRERATRGALWGAGTLGVAGFLMTDRGKDTSEVQAAFYSLLAGAIWGGVIGFVIPQNRWQPVHLATAPGNASEVAQPRPGFSLYGSTGDQDDDVHQVR
jgi:hypothetical protein